MIKWTYHEVVSMIVYELLHTLLEGGGGGGGWLFPEPYGQREAAHVSSPILDLISMIIWRSWS